MPLYAYRALNEKGRSVRGKMHAANDVDLFQALKGIGLELIDASTVKERRLAVAFAPAIKIRDQIQLCVHLEQLQNAGVPLVEGLADVRDSTENARLRDLLAEIYRDVSDGASLSDAFGKHPRVFGPVFTSLLAAGETSGNLGESFAQLVKHLKWTDAVNAKIKKAIRYPMVIMLLMIGLFFFMMTVVVPQVIGFLDNMGTQLPLATTSLMATSDVVQGYWWLLIGGPVGAFLALTAARRAIPAIAYRVDALLLALPVFGTMLRKLALSRFAHFFAIMFQSGVPILSCLETAQRVVVNRVLQNALETVRDQVQTGVPLSRALERSGQFPSLVIRMVRIGEESGNLSTTLGNVTEFYDRDVEETVDRVVAMAEPALTIGAAVLMIWIIIGVFGPVYDTFENVGI